MASPEQLDSGIHELPLRDLRTAIDSMPEAVLVLDKNYTILYQNVAAKALSGLETGSELAEIARAIERRTPDGQLIELENGPVMRALRGEIVDNEEVHVRNQLTGKQFMLLYSAVPIRDEHGSVVRAVVNISDVTEQRRSEQAIRAGEARLQAIIDNLAEGLVVVDPVLRTLTWNPAALRLHGHETMNEDLSYLDRVKTVYELRTLEGRPVPFDEWPIERMMRGETFRDLEFRIRRVGSDSERVFGYSGTLVRDPQGRPATGLLTMRDVTAVREATLRFQALADNISQFAWMADREGWLFWYNRRWYEYTGTSLEEMQGWGWRKVHHPDYVERVTEKFRDSVHRGEPWEDTFPLRSKTGEYRWFLSRALPIRNEAGEIVTWFGTNTDITEVRNAAAELERINRIVKLAHAAGRSGAWEWNLKTSEMTWTEEYYRVFGLEPNFTPTLERFYGLIHPDDRESVLASTEETVRSGATEFGTEFRTILPDGVHWIERRGQVVRDSKGRAIRLVGISTDITERKRLEQALMESNDDLARFAYVSSHDLQEPLRTICTFSTLLERRNRGKLDENSEQFLDYIVAGAKRMTGLVNDLLQYSRITNDPTTPGPVDLGVGLQAARDNLREAIAETGATIEAGNMPLVVGSESLLTRVFQNLLGNAIKYCSPERKPHIKVDAVRRGGEWVISVKDNGIGFSKEYAEQIFVIFKRLHGPGEYAGSGIGLAVVKRIIERHGGTVWAESTPGEGSTFHFSLPIRYERPA